MSKPNPIVAQKAVVELRLNIPDHPNEPSVAFWLRVNDRLLRLDDRQAAFLLANGYRLHFIQSNAEGETRVELGGSK